MKLEITAFDGLLPKRAKHLLPDGGATIARDCRLGSGMLRPLAFMRKDHVLAYPEGSIFRWRDGEWLNYADAGRHFVPGAIYGDDQRLYMSAEAGGLSVLASQSGEVQLGCPAPLATPTLEVTGSAASGEDMTSRVYVYTCVNSLGDERAPSHASEVKDVQGQTVVVGNMVTPPHAGYAAITKKRIYRLAVGDESADYLFVAEIEASVNSYTDKLTDGELGEVLPSLGWKTPASDLQGLVSVPGNVLAAFRGQEVRFSAPNYPYAWPDSYAHTVEYDIVGLECSGTVLFIFTTGPVYYMSVDALESAVPVSMDGSCPCLSARGIIPVPGGVVFPSRDGLYMVGSGYAIPLRMTTAYYAKEEWLAMRPATMFGAWCGGYLYLFFADREGLIFELGIDDGEAGIRNLTTTNVPVSALTVAMEGERLFVASGNDCWEWEGMTGTLRSAEWQSRSFLLANKTNFGAAVVEQEIDDDDSSEAEEELLVLAYDSYIEAHAGAIDGGLAVLPQSEVGMGTDGAGGYQAEQVSGVKKDVVLTVYADGEAVFEREIIDREPFCLPGGFTARTWYVRVRTNRDLRRIAIAESMSELYE